MRIFLHTTRFGPGGAQRVLARLAAAWAEPPGRVALATFDPPGATPFFPLPDTVEFLPLGAGDAWRLPPARLSARLGRLRSAIRRFQPDAIVSFQPTANLHALLAARGMPAPVIISERNAPERLKLGLWRRWARRAVYASASQIVVQTDRAKLALPPAWRGKTVVIPNAIERPELCRGGQRSAPVLLAVGRLERQKGFDLLLEAYARVADRHRAWSLVIVGDGAERESLEAQARRLGLSDGVRFAGAVSDVAPYYASSDAFVLSSRYEGFPNALAEAMAAGLPVVAADCPNGPREMIDSEVDGLLVAGESVEALAQGLDRLLSDEALRERLARNAPAICERFSPSRILGLWEETLRTALAARAKAAAA